MEYILDTNICIYIIKKKPIVVFEEFKKSPIGSIGISSITLAELKFGVMKSSNPVKNQEALMNFLTPLEIIDFDYDSALHYGKIRAYLEIKGIPIGSLDMLIAATALSNNSVLITNNEKEFRRIPELKVQNWIK